MHPALASFVSIRRQVNIAKKVEPFTGRVLALDPGETTGFACFQTGIGDDLHTIKYGQIKTWPEGPMVDGLTSLIQETKPTFIVFERYSIYEWKTDSHAWSGVPTIQIIGCLKTLCSQQRISWHAQTAYEAKNFCTDEKLKQWGFWAEGQKHARDAFRHACYFLLFGITIEKQQQ